MKKILGLMTAFLLIGTMAMAQNSTVQTATKETAKKCCKPSKACAKAMGISLEECKKICGEAGSSADASTDSKATLVGLTNASPKSVAKKRCPNAAKCCPSKGMDSKANAGSAPVKLVSNLEGRNPVVLSTAKKCCKKKTCTKKTAMSN